MKAVVVDRFGSADVMRVDEVEQPVLKPGQVKVKNFYSTVNPVDWKIRRGDLKLMTGFKPPKKLGSDFAGEVIEVAPDVDDFRVGQRVYGFVDPLTGGGYGEQLCVAAKRIATIPESMSYEHAATIPLCAQTAYQSLVGLGAIKKGDTVVINGCSGGVGVMALQIAKAFGANVIGVCSERNSELAKSLGADVVIDYNQDPGLSSLKNINIFFDVVANKSFLAVRNSLSSNGCYITTIPGPTSALSFAATYFFCSKKSYIVLASSKTQDLQSINKLIVKNDLKAHISQSYKLSDIVEAHLSAETSRTVGKISINIGTFI